MSSEIEKALERELTSIEVRLRANPDYVRATMIRDLLATYRTRGNVSGATARMSVARRSSGEPSKRERVLAEIENELRNNGHVHRKALLDMLVVKGLMGAEKNPMQQLAIYLSDAKDRFENHGQGMWSLRTKGTWLFDGTNEPGESPGS